MANAAKQAKKTRRHATCPQRNRKKGPSHWRPAAVCAMMKKNHFHAGRICLWNFTYPPGLEKGPDLQLRRRPGVRQAAGGNLQPARLKGHLPPELRHFGGCTPPTGISSPRGGEGAVPGPRGGRPHREPPASHVLSPCPRSPGKSPRTARPWRPSPAAWWWACPTPMAATLRRGGGRGQGPGDFVLPHHPWPPGSSTCPRTSSAGTPPATTATPGCWIWARNSWPPRTWASL